jgi:Tol biopolymer transport system component
VTVTAAAEGKIGVANLTVASITLVHINGPTYAMEPGTTTQLAASVLDSAYHPVPIPVTWSSLDNSIATVSSSGLVNVHTIGVATISASVGSVTGSFDIGVQHAVTGKIAFVSKRGRIICSYCDNQAGGIYLMNVDGSQQELLIEDQIMRCNPDPGPPNELCFFPWQEPSLAKDGLRLAAISQVRYDTEYSGSMMFLCTITPPSCSILDYPIEIRRPWIYTVPRVALVGVSSPAWSPNGATMAFGYGGIGVWNFVSGVGSRVDPDQGEQPTWSPDGIHIAFTSRRNGNNDIWMMNADGSNLVNLTNNAGEDSQPTWAPDGNRIAFVSNRDGNDEIYIMNRDGSSQTNVSHNVASDAHPTWSPDGTQIAFQTDRDGNSEIYVMYADGSNQTNITRNPAEDTSPSWGP